MKNIDLGKSGLSAPEITVGCMRMSALSLKETTEVIRASMDVGINFFEHADIYGAGDCEEIFGKAINELGIKREELLLQTKCGIEIKPNWAGLLSYNFTKDYIIHCVEQSLKRLQTDYVDVLALHRPDTLMEPDEIAEVFETLHSSGKVRNFGVSNFNSEQMVLLQKSVPFKLIVNQLQLSLVHTGMLDCGFNVNVANNAANNKDGSILEFCRHQDVTIQAWSPFIRSSTGKVFIDDPDLPELNSKMAEIAEKYNVTKDAVAVAWILRHPAKIQVVIGSMNPERIKNIAKASDFTLTHHEWYALYMSAGNNLP